MTMPPPKAGRLRRSLDALYVTSGFLAGLFLAAIAVSIVAQIVGRFAGVAIDGTELAGFSMAASTFLGLAYTLKSGTHVRVTLLVRHVPAPLKFAFEVACASIGVIASAYFTYFASKLVIQSWNFGDISPGLVAMPFWIPQSGMALGGLLLTIAFIDELLIVLSGEAPGYDADEAILDNVPVAAADAPMGEDTPQPATGR